MMVFCLGLHVKLGKNKSGTASLQKWEATILTEAKRSASRFSVSGNSLPRASRRFVRLQRPLGARDLRVELLRGRHGGAG